MNLTIGKNIGRNLTSAEYSSHDIDQFTAPLAESDRALLAKRRRLFAMCGCEAMVILMVLQFLV